MGGPNTHGDPVLFMREQASIIESLQQRLARGASEHPASRRAREWAAKSAPNAYVREYVNAWTRGAQSAESTMDALTDPNGILVREAGDYEIIAMQRGNGTNVGTAYIGIALDGDRNVLQLRTSGVWTHDHSAAVNSFSTSRYLGPLDADSFITVGPPNTTGRDAMTYSSNATEGSIFIRRIS